MSRKPAPKPRARKPAPIATPKPRHANGKPATPRRTTTSAPVALNGHAPRSSNPRPSSPLTNWDYSPAPETVPVTIAPAYGHFINGSFVDPDPLTRVPTINPANQRVLSHVALGSPADVDAAVTAARSALPAWSALPAQERAKYLFRIARRIQERARELAVLETMDGGKPIRESRDVDIPLAAQHFFYHAGWADKLKYAFPGRTPSPVGVCAQIIPWNFPLLMAAWKLAPALACGNTCVLKPAETTPLTALRLAEILQEADLPPGVVNIVTGDGSTGAALVNHPGIDKLAFTGSTEVGKNIAARLAQQDPSRPHPVRLTLELGGKSANIIFDDAPVDQAVEGIIDGIFFNQGHVCCAGSRLLVQESILPEVLRKLRIRMARLRVGDPLDKNTDVGAINSREQLERIRTHIRTAIAEGNALTVPASRNASAVEADAFPASDGFFCRPCFFSNVQPSDSVARHEVFGPVLAVMSFRTPEEAILRANNTPYGLAAGVWTDKGSKIFEIARQLDAGVVWLNTYNKFDPASPFGGFKESGFGREGGLQGLRAYVNLT